MQPPKTILHTIETSGIGGAESVLLQIAARLDRDRFRSVAAVPERGALQQALEDRGVATHIVPSRRWWDIRLPLGLARVCRQERVDLVHAHLPEYAFSGCLAGSLVRRPVIATYHGQLDFWRANTWRGRAKLGVVRRSAAAAVGVCDDVRSTLLARKFPQDRVRRIYNGVDVTAARGTATAGLRQQFGWAGATPLVGTVANVRVTKGYEYFVRAARIVVDANPAARFVAAGDVDAELGPPIRALITELGLDDHVKLLGFRADVLGVLRDLDVFMMASTSEGFPLVLLEAMAAGKAVVATRCGGTAELIWDGVNGRLVPVRDPAALADAVLGMLNDRDLATRLSAAAAEDAADFSVDHMVTEYQDLYDSVLASR
ncbi:MAG TPA: glycosyltransferase [Gemmatimonadaceae bacterium]